MQQASRSSLVRVSGGSGNIRLLQIRIGGMRTQRLAKVRSDHGGIAIAKMRGNGGWRSSQPLFRVCFEPVGLEKAVVIEARFDVVPCPSMEFHPAPDQRTPQYVRGRPRPSRAHISFEQIGQHIDLSPTNFFVSFARA